MVIINVLFYEMKKKLKKKRDTQVKKKESINKKKTIGQV